MLWYRQVMHVVGGELADGLHPEGGGKQLLFNWQPVPSGVHQGLILGPTLFNALTSDVDDGIKCAMRKFPDDTKLRGEVDTLGEPPCRKTWRSGLTRTL